jgi:hypothetical protein
MNRSHWLPIAGLGLALLIVTLDIFEYWRSSTSGNAALAFALGSVAVGRMDTSCHN